MRHCFTLLELIVVMSVMFLAASMSVAVLKKESPAKKLENAALEWRDFCARVRFQALESGTERQIVFDAGKKTFLMRDPNAKTDEESNNGDEEQETKPVSIEWKLPDNFELGDFPDPNEEPDETGCYLMFTFYSDGGASGKRKLELHTGELSKVFEISTLTGRLIETSETEEKLQ